jgi:putative nucleotidyltransferase with HDIG domain
MNNVYSFTPYNKAFSAESRPTQTLPEQARNQFAVLFTALQANDPDLYIHSQRVRRLARKLAHLSGIAYEEAQIIELAALFHDIGKLAIRDEILQKPSRLTPQEYEEIKIHTAYGALMLGKLHASPNITSIIYYHHEHWDGSGYPSGLRGVSIPLGSRILAIADAFEAMTSYRPYQPIRTPKQAREELLRCAGTQFDPALVTCFCTNLIIDESVFSFA